MSHQEKENHRLSASNSIEDEEDSSESNNEVNNADVEDAFESKDLEASHFTYDSLGEIRYESHDLESQLQLQLLSSNKIAQKIKELKKKVEDTEVELGIAHSLIDNLKEELAESFNAVSLQDSKIILLGNEVIDLKRQISELRSNLSIVETTTSEAKTRHHFKIEATRVAAGEEAKG
ncbi:hypothetical protein F0562_032405 [Nyssa sinensis]|uniref:Uncharacterized protein n=1 Tax=Nyssa sinensis TaxID=561372 RepID=A0A5J5ANU4_9ASTE|nr:hypothetical protein F0562_032405 [Nyssa sinensis]